MPLDDKAVEKMVAEAKKKPAWARTKVPPVGALEIRIKAGQSIVTSEGVYDFEADGEWILLPTPVWARTLQRLRAAEVRVTGKGDGGPRSN